jgi:hypothetical protein
MKFELELKPVATKLFWPHKVGDLSLDLKADNPHLNKWWKCHSETLPNWSGAASTALLVQPSSAAVECIFLVRRCSFGDQHCKTIETSLECDVGINLALISDIPQAYPGAWHI